MRTRCFRARALLREKLAEDIPNLGEVFPFDGDNCRRVARRAVEALRLAD